MMPSPTPKTGVDNESTLFLDKKYPNPLDALPSATRKALYKNLTVDSEQKRGMFGALGVFQFADQDNEPFPLFDRQYAEFLEKEHIDKYTLLKDNLSFQSEMLKGLGMEFKNDGQALAYLAGIAQLPAADGRRNEVINQINENLYANFRVMINPGDQKNELELPEKINHLKEYCEMADEIYNKFTNVAYGKNAEVFFGLREEVAQENNPGKLWLMMVNPSLSPRLRFEAYRKLYFARELVAIKDVLRNDEFINYFTRNLDEADFYVREEGSESPKLTTVYVLSDHPDPKTRHCERAVFLTKRPDKIHEDQRLTELKMRSVVNPKTNEEYFIYHSSRTKEPLSILMKAMKKGLKDYQGMTDLYGGLIMAENEEEVLSASHQLKESLRLQGCGYRFLEKENGFNGKKNRQHTAGQSQAFKNMSAGVEIKFPKKLDENGEVIQNSITRRMERQGMTVTMWADAKYSLVTAHPLYEYRRLHDAEITKLINPPHLYNYDPLREYYGMEKERVKSLEWNGSSVQDAAINFLTRKMKEAEQKGDFVLVSQLRQLAIEDGLDIRGVAETSAIDDFRKAKERAKEVMEAGKEVATLAIRATRKSIRYLLGR